MGKKKGKPSDTTVRYVDGNGKVRFKGSTTLKQTQLIGCNGKCSVVHVFILEQYLLW